MDGSDWKCLDNNGTVRLDAYVNTVFQVWRIMIGRGTKKLFMGN